MSAILLRLHDGRLVDFTAEELGATIARLAALDQLYCLGRDQIVHARVGDRLLLIDAGWFVNRRLIETHILTPDPSFAFGIRATQGQIHRSLEEALRASGWLGGSP